jgi:toluene monooxygenase electron transfer component
VLEGETQNLFPDAPALTERDVRKGMVLACQNKCLGNDLVIKTRLESWNPNLVKPQRFKMSLEEKIEIASDLVEFVFALDQDVEYRAGQFFMLDIPGVGERAYSNSSIATGARQIRFVIKRMPAGKGSNYLFHDAEVGDEIGCDGPYGHSYFRDDVERDVVLVAGGSGLSPMLSILRYLSANPGLDRSVHFYYGAKALNELNENYIKTRFTLSCGLSGTDEECGDWRGEKGFIHEVVDRNLEHYGDKEFYLCGPPPMTAAAQKHLMVEKSVPFDQVHFDRFF